MPTALSPHRPRRAGRSDGPLRRAGEVVQSARAAELAALRARVAVLELDNYRLAARVEELEAELAAALARERHLSRRTFAPVALATKTPPPQVATATVVTPQPPAASGRSHPMPTATTAPAPSKLSAVQQATRQAQADKAAERRMREEARRPAVDEAAVRAAAEAEWSANPSARIKFSSKERLVAAALAAAHGRTDATPADENLVERIVSPQQ